MDITTIQPQGYPEFGAVQRAGNAAYDQAIAGSNESAYDAYSETTTALTAQLKAGELWLCPACRKELTPVDTLCTYCESEERDHAAVRWAQARMRHGRG